MLLDQLLDRFPTRILWTLALIGCFLAGLLGGGMVLLAGGSLAFAGELAGFLILFELMYYGLAVFIWDFPPRRQIQSETTEALVTEDMNALHTRIERARERIQRRGQLIQADICPECGQPMRKVEIRGHVVAQPCGHSLYKGTLRR